VREEGTGLKGLGREVGLLVVEVPGRAFLGGMMGENAWRLRMGVGVY